MLDIGDTFTPEWKRIKKYITLINEEKGKKYIRLK